MKFMEVSEQARTQSRSLADVHASVSTLQPSFWRRMFAFAGPAYLVSVGYMDPGNWATDLEGGARFGYRLLWVLVMSNAMAILLQTLSARLGIVTGRDLAQACRERYPRGVNFALWILCEVAIAACDLAEVLGAAIGLNLLFHIPLLAGVLLTALDTLLLLLFQSFGIRTLEAFVLALISVIAGCFLIELMWAKPAFGDLAAGLVPGLNNGSLYLIITIIGATVMPHNLYLHSALVQTRHIGQDDEAKRVACRYNLIDSAVALNGAMFVNIAILVMSAAVFFERHIAVTEIQQAYLLLTPLLHAGLASVVFATALLCSGQSSTLTGTLAGQVVMEGFLDVRMRPWLRRLSTRALAVIPAAVTIYLAGDQSTLGLLLLSQCILSLQLPFAIIPLIHFTNDRRRMGPFANRAWVRWLAWTVAGIIIALNLKLAVETLGDWASHAGPWRPLILAIVAPLCVGLLGLLGWVAFEPYLVPGWTPWRRSSATATLPAAASPQDAIAPAPAYTRILAPLDHTALDRLTLTHAAAIARLHHAKVYLLHVEEGVTSQVYGGDASTAEVEAGAAYLENIARSFREQGIEVETAICHSSSPKREIVRYANEIHPDLVVMGAHGHGGLKDLIFGNTINPVRHDLDVPMLIVRPGKG